VERLRLLALLAIGYQGMLLEQIAAASSAEDEEKQVLAASQNLILAHEEERKTAERLRDRGIVSSDEVDTCTLQIASAKHYLAAQQNEPDVARDQRESMDNVIISLL
jgi:multidrug resistance efflux pump